MIPEPTVTVDPAFVPARALVPGCRYFSADDGSADYTIVASDLEHAKRILRSSASEFCNEDGDVVPFDEAQMEFTEITAERAAEIRVYTDDGCTGPFPLNTFAAGEWFCSEF